MPIALIGTDLQNESHLGGLNEIPSSVLHGRKNNLISSAIKHPISPVSAVVVQHLHNRVRVELQMRLHLLETVLRDSYLRHQFSFPRKRPELLPKLVHDLAAVDEDERVLVRAATIRQFRSDILGHDLLR